jgi:hypothetical protein
MTLFDIPTHRSFSAFTMRFENKQLLVKLSEMQMLLESHGKKINTQKMIEEIIIEKHTQLRKEGKL